ncbi:hypothetical protein ElyMa_006022800 [Elysia marginata]|uniref:Uncharacterized protein n=1 Tax=Elysia marginata TaxID=1093978 RepID=A0AAV4GLF6_9GAST|nr:hypothetical protein ElyMa_006022800 [Elysia marginata]
MIAITIVIITMITMITIVIIIIVFFIVASFFLFFSTMSIFYQDSARSEKSDLTKDENSFSCSSGKRLQYIISGSPRQDKSWFSAMLSDPKTSCDTF